MSDEQRTTNRRPADNESTPASDVLSASLARRVQQTRSMVSPWIQRALQQPAADTDAGRHAATRPMMAMSTQFTLDRVRRVRRTTQEAQAWKPDVGSVSPDTFDRFAGEIVNRHEPFGARVEKVGRREQPVQEGQDDLPLAHHPPVQVAPRETPPPDYGEYDGYDAGDETQSYQAPPTQQSVTPPQQPSPPSPAEQSRRAQEQIQRRPAQPETGESSRPKRVRVYSSVEEITPGGTMTDVDATGAVPSPDAAEPDDPSTAARPDETDDSATAGELPHPEESEDRIQRTAEPAEHVEPQSPTDHTVSPDADRTSPPTDTAPAQTDAGSASERVQRSETGASERRHPTESKHTDVPSDTASPRVQRRPETTDTSDEPPPDEPVAADDQSIDVDDEPPDEPAPGDTTVSETPTDTSLDRSRQTSDDSHVQRSSDRPADRRPSERSAARPDRESVPDTGERHRERRPEQARRTSERDPDRPAIRRQADETPASEAHPAPPDVDDAPADQTDASTAHEPTPEVGSEEMPPTTQDETPTLSTDSGSIGRTPDPGADDAREQHSLHPKTPSDSERQTEPHRPADPPDTQPRPAPDSQPAVDRARSERPAIRRKPTSEDPVQREEQSAEPSPSSSPSDTRRAQPRAVTRADSESSSLQRSPDRESSPSDSIREQAGDDVRSTPERPAPTDSTSDDSLSQPDVRAIQRQPEPEPPASATLESGDVRRAPERTSSSASSSEPTAETPAQQKRPSGEATVDTRAIDSPPEPNEQTLQRRTESETPATAPDGEQTPDPAPERDRSAIRRTPERSSPSDSSSEPAADTPAEQGQSPEETATVASSPAADSPSQQDEHPIQRAPEQEPPAEPTATDHGPDAIQSSPAADSSVADETARPTIRRTAEPLDAPPLDLERGSRSDAIEAAAPAPSERIQRADERESEEQKAESPTTRDRAAPADPGKTGPAVARLRTTSGTDDAGDTATEAPVQRAPDVETRPTQHEGKSEPTPSDDRPTATEQTRDAPSVRRTPASEQSRQPGTQDRPVQTPPAIQTEETVTRDADSLQRAPDSPEQPAADLLDSDISSQEEPQQQEPETDAGDPSVSSAPDSPPEHVQRATDEATAPEPSADDRTEPTDRGTPPTPEEPRRPATDIDAPSESASPPQVQRRSAPDQDSPGLESSPPAQHRQTPTHDTPSIQRTPDAEPHRETDEPTSSAERSVQPEWGESPTGDVSPPSVQRTPDRSTSKPASPPQYEPSPPSAPSRDDDSPPDVQRTPEQSASVPEPSGLDTSSDNGATQPEQTLVQRHREPAPQTDAGRDVPASHEPSPRSQIRDAAEPATRVQPPERRSDSSEQRTDLPLIRRTPDTEAPASGEQIDGDIERHSDTTSDRDSRTAADVASSDSLEQTLVARAVSHVRLPLTTRRRPVVQRTPGQKASIDGTAVSEERSPEFALPALFERAPTARTQRMAQTLPATAILPQTRPADALQRMPVADRQPEPVAHDGRRRPLEYVQQQPVTTAETIQRREEQQPSAPEPDTESEEQSLDLDTLARQVYPIIKRMIAVERERRPGL